MATQAPRTDQTWRPEGRWADSLIVLLALLSVLMAWANLQRRAAPRAQVEQPTLQGRVLDVQAGVLGPKAPWGKLERQASTPWDKALVAIHAAEAGKPEVAARCLTGSPAGFEAVWQRAYGGTPPCDPTAIAQAEKGLGRAYAASLLRARILEVEGRDAAAFRHQARIEFWERLAVLGALGGCAALLLLSGMAFALFLALKKSSAPARLPSLNSDGRSLALLFLGWFLVMQVSGQVVQIILGILPFLRPWSLSLAYLVHAGFATTMLCRMEGLRLSQIWRRMNPGPLKPSLGWGLGYLGLTVLAALLLSLALSPVLPSQEPPQRELVEIMAKARGWHTALPLFLTVAVLAPCFEELMFRGCLIPSLRRRLGPWPALFIGALAFGAMHLQPLGLPMLSLLGLTMGMAFLRTGNLWTSILVHGCWNGAQFLLMRALYG